MLRDFQTIIGRASAVIPRVDAAFERACLMLLTEAFKRMKEEGTFDLSWKETCFSARLIGYMRKIRKENDIALRIEPESYLYQKEICEGSFDPDRAPRIDIKVSGGWVYEDVYYGMEAKIVVEQNWQTRNANGLCRRYIETGVDNFVNGHYSDKIPRGCIMGYVVQGNAQTIATNINNLLRGRRRNEEIMRNHYVFNDCSDCYLSNHTRITDLQAVDLRHVFLTFC